MGFLGDLITAVSLATLRHWLLLMVAGCGYALVMRALLRAAITPPLRWAALIAATAFFGALVAAGLLGMT